MIVNNTNKGWEIIYQRAHGLLAAEIAQNWNFPERSDKWIETLTAICDHDDNQQTWHGTKHLTPQKTPQDFTMQPPDLQQAKNVMQAAELKSTWVALLISSHIDRLYHHHSNKDKDLAEFLDYIKAFRKRGLKMIDRSASELQTTYKLMYWCDRLSLILCKNECPPDGSRLQIAEGPDKRCHSIFKREDNSLGITPWPFKKAHFDVSIETRITKSVVFKDDHDLYKELKDSPIIPKKWTFKSDG